MPKKIDWDEYARNGGNFPPLPTFSEWYKRWWKQAIGWDLKIDLE